MRGSASARLRHLLAGAAFSFSAGAAGAVDLQEPITLQSRNGVLDILLVAKAAAIPSLSPMNPTGWVYDICLNPHNGANDCPVVSGSPNLYGGTRLQLSQGDTLKIHLVNKLPPITDSDHAQDPAEAFLALNPTNIHTHGLLVSPRYPSKSDPTYGDNVFVLTFNSSNGTPIVSPHIHGVVAFDSTDYSIKIPAHHPSGLYWFHPHAHGIALDQVSAGMAGIITIGNVGDYVCNDSGCSTFSKTIGVRHLILKDTQVLADGTLKDQGDPDFCSQRVRSRSRVLWGRAIAQARIIAAMMRAYTGGRWFFTINGQQFPNIPETAAGGEIWRITNASASIIYDLGLWNPAQNQDMIVQVLSIDGVGISPVAGLSSQAMAQIIGNKVSPLPCPGVAAASDSKLGVQPVCTTRLLMMPSTRAEIRVAYRDATGALTAPPPGAQAIFRTAGFVTGSDGDTWPTVDLGTVLFESPAAKAKAPAALSVNGGVATLTVPRALASDLASANAAVGEDAMCKTLPKNHKRRIFFNAPTDPPDAFGLGYEELDEHNIPVPGTFMDVKAFDPMTPTVCLPLEAGNAPVTERWELVNLAGEDHSFHMHQVRFRALSAAELDQTSLPSQISGQGVLLDRVPLAHADGICASVDDWRKGACTAHPVTVDIPFAIAGDFVYHCHILEHEDGGMMARIRVRPSIGGQAAALH
jgi:L-ascorbate oxidase